MGCCLSDKSAVAELEARKELELVKAENAELRRENERLRQQSLRPGTGASEPATPSAVRLEESDPPPVLPVAAEEAVPAIDAKGTPAEPSPVDVPGVDAADAQQVPVQEEEQKQDAPEQNFAGLKRGFLTSGEAEVVQASLQEAPEQVQGVPQPTSAYSFSTAARAHAKEELGGCMLCLEPLPNDPREVVNLCASEPRCLCLLHRSCFLNPQYEMSDTFRRCMICKQPADPALVRMAVQARQRPRA
eukprot:TRINITY_DN31350_c0_g1_i1.p1 TRINITY_DN31350_c0_g1~~TRINITY_DN31350_c0_g1_i1.p1  ORF type:complete len:246 (-),score=51.34 TRINITY_DN31350_c0_g1_i1:75-812(-)